MNDQSTASLRRGVVALATTVVICAIVPCLRTAAADERSATPATQPSAELLRSAPAAKPATPFDPTDAYDVQTVEGWKVRVNQRLLHDQPDVAAQAIELLQNHLYQVTREVPAPAVKKLRTITLWLELNDPQVIGACYHPDAGWLRAHGLNPEKKGCVELGNAKRFLEWAHSQPWMILHELAHAYHDQFVPGGFENPEILAAYQAAKEEKLYDAVLRNNGRTERAYAMTNHKEYFAECSEAFFGTNDFYPFVRVELKAHDPRGFAALTHAWGGAVPGVIAATSPASQPAVPTHASNAKPE